MPTLRTVVCIDGLNLFQSRLSGTCYKWLDLWALINLLMTDSQPTSMISQIQSVRFFTSPIMVSYATDPDSQRRQNVYHQALEHGPSGQVEVIQGKHVLETKKGKLSDSNDDRVARFSSLEEKQTDVNLALSLYSAALDPEVDQVVLVSNDSDFEPALERIRVERPEKRIGLILPLRDKKAGNRSAQSLVSRSTWARRLIHDHELKDSQLPGVIYRKSRRRWKSITRPSSW